ncbi:MAG: serine hydrolase [Pseudomonadota bacterium]
MARLIIVFGVIAALLIGGGIVADPYARVGAGYMAKVLCSEVFVAGRPEEAVLEHEFDDINPFLRFATTTVDPSEGIVLASIFGLGRSEAVFRRGYGCTLTVDGAPSDLPTLHQVTDLPPATNADPALQAIVDGAIKAEDGHRALLVLRGGEIIAEAYADGFDKDTPFLSWSMAKSITSAMVGIAVERDLLDLETPPLVPEWQGADDPRRAITWDNLLKMQTGLAFEEDYVDPTSDVLQMLYDAQDMGGVAAAQSLAHDPGTYWYYASGTTNIIQRALRATLEDQGVSYHLFPGDVLFGPLGAASVVFETDPSGTFVGSSYLYATARDWAKLGQLYLLDGVWNGQRVLPEGWVDYSREIAARSDGFYGAQFWLNHPGAEERQKYFPGIPDEAFIMAGHDGQYVLIVPDKDLVLVRLGITRTVEPISVTAPVMAELYAAL